MATLGPESLCGLINLAENCLPGYCFHGAGEQATSELEAHALIVTLFAQALTSALSLELDLMSAVGG